MFRIFHTNSYRVHRERGFFFPRLTHLVLLLAAAHSQSQLFAVQPSLSVTCRPDKSVLCNSTWTFDAPGASGGCGAITITEQGTSIPTTICGKTYSVTRTWLVSDGCTNVPCSQTVTVKAKAPDLDSAP